tara:strand:+ start:291 stop:533 length:243 start_codon:yes stop_codon:yes gene_type:complete
MDQLNLPCTINNEKLYIMKKLVFLLLLVPMVSLGQVQVQGTVPTYENPNPQPIQVQSQNNSYSTSSNNRPIIVNRSTSAQ